MQYLISGVASICFGVATSSVYCSCTSAAENEVKRCADFLDSNCHWGIDFSNMESFHHNVASGLVSMQILRLQTEYVSSLGVQSPFMRMVCFLPSVSTERACEFIADVALRKSWDENYGSFEKEYEGPVVANAVIPYSRPIEMVAGKVGVCEGNACKLEPNVVKTLTDSNFYAHRVRTGFAGHFGIADRLFFYKRNTFTYAPRNPLCASPMVDILYHGNSSMIKDKEESGGDTSRWIKKVKSEGKFEPAFMNYQHVVLVPIADAQRQLFKHADTFDSLATTGSMFDETSSKKLYDLTKQSGSIVEDGCTGVSGTLLIMTSANEVGVPRFIPLWSQKRISARVTLKAYESLLFAIHDKSA